MVSMLKDWMELSKADLEQKGFTVTISDQDDNFSSVNLDSDDFVGTICFWKPNTFEFQFNDCETGDVALLETRELESIEDVAKYFQGLLLKIGISSRRAQ